MDHRERIPILPSAPIVLVIGLELLILALRMDRAEGSRLSAVIYRQYNLADSREPI